MLTQNQLRLFSSEWRTLFANLESRNYHLSYNSGVIEIRHATAGINMDVELDTERRGRWKMTLYKPFGMLPIIDRKRHDSHMIEMISYWLNRAEQSPLMYSFIRPVIVGVQGVTA
ncbi:hypothetical protein JJB07_14670 [Tumebacillus sp. ITR2]|uniref:Uncharacterized protein n=1 Tax=Tumebacillus amylolyticus TaxID=2801339 RepID=A0ABS1JC91_9BACL|nr:hypothetical protein [Tumebacillus amylolyticus]MBL0387882.1 hypothetical protein [Tumebacillus amylolyticus]